MRLLCIEALISVTMRTSMLDISVNRNHLLAFTLMLTLNSSFKCDSISLINICVLGHTQNRWNMVSTLSSAHYNRATTDLLPQKEQALDCDTLMLNRYLFVA